MINRIARLASKLHRRLATVTAGVLPASRYPIMRLPGVLPMRSVQVSGAAARQSEPHGGYNGAYEGRIRNQSPPISIYPQANATSHALDGGLLRWSHCESEHTAGMGIS